MRPEYAFPFGLLLPLPETPELAARMPRPTSACRCHLCCQFHNYLRLEHRYLRLNLPPERPTTITTVVFVIPRRTSSENVPAAVLG